uniref:Uncharacterized protein n=1 Tax=Oryza sativa subsp. japonica TaxID=39947 RepID=Q6EP44_ORYSJ|nr:hypothetical protein [Oryza sativa Japonica Group]BAD29576.1 hypothetical protein [Oryza sativa Japonica Group]
MGDGDVAAVWGVWGFEGKAGEFRGFCCWKQQPASQSKWQLGLEKARPWWWRGASSEF